MFHIEVQFPQTFFQIKYIIQGRIRTPVLCFNNEHKSMERMKLKNYEVSPIELLHDVKGHVHNLWDVLSEVMSQDLKEKFQTILFKCYGSKGKVRGVDYKYICLLIVRAISSVSFNIEYKRAL